MAFTLVRNEYIENGLPTSAANNNRPCVFHYDNEMYYLDGSANALKWNSVSEAWESNTPFSTYNVSPGTAKGSTVFYIGSEMYMVKGGSTATPLGYKWNNTNQQWEQNAAILTGIDLTGYTYLDPDAFYYNDELYLIFSTNQYTFIGYKWNGSSWDSNSFIIAGLSTSRTFVRPGIIQLGTEMYMVIYSTAGNQFKWNATLSTWEAFTISGLPGGTNPGWEFFSYDGHYYLMWVSNSSVPYVYEIVFDDLNSFSHDRYNQQLRLTATTTVETPEADELKCYYSEEETGLIDPANIVSLSSSDNVTFEAIVPEADAVDFYAAVEYYKNGVLTETLNISDYFTKVDQKDTTAVNITNTDNYVILDDPAHDLNHGFLIHDGYLYGSARSKSGSTYESSVFKIQASDYSVLSQTNIYRDKTGSTLQLVGFDQIVYLKGFLWMNFGEYLVRINPSDLDYMIFDNLAGMSFKHPIGADNDYLYYTGDDYVYKLDADLLLDTFASYGYTGAAPVNIPSAAILSSCAIIQHHPTYNAYLHSIITDANYIYAAFTTAGTTEINGYMDGIYFFHVQKINKTTMQTVGDVIIPKTTDDMVQDSEYIYLAPEYQAGADSSYLGYDWGLFAINKNTLEIKFLKSLHADQVSSDCIYRQCYGVFYFNDEISVQQAITRLTFIIDTSQVEQWGTYFPVGGATKNIFKFQLNGVDLIVPCNELLVDTAGYVHTHTWGEDTMVFKFTADTIFETSAQEPLIQTLLISSDDADATVQGEIINTGQSAMTAVGFLYGTDPESLTTNVPATLGDTFEETLSSLTSGIYYIQAYGTNSEGTWYGNIIVFSTYNVMIAYYDNDNIVLDWIAKNSGCSIRCVQDAPGVTDGTTGTAEDIDGNVYDTIVINERRWFVQNLRTTKNKNGVSIPFLQDDTDWANDTDGAECIYP